MKIDALKTVFSVIAIALLATFAMAQEASAPREEAGKPTPTADLEAQAIEQVSQSLVDTFNRKQADELASLFLPGAELIDDAGNSHDGREEIKDIFTKFIELFPDATMARDIESIRVAAGELGIENGTRTITTSNDAEAATNRYTTVYVKRDGTWKIAVVREVPDDPEPTPHDRLQTLAWLVGDWVDEDAEAAISISCRWDPSDSFLLVDFVAKVSGETVMESKQRLGWDPLAKGIRSWVFDSDGGFGEGRWTVVDGKWIVKSTAVLPDGTTGSATIFLEPAGEDRFLMKGFDRVLGDTVEPDFEATIVRKPPEPAK